MEIAQFQFSLFGINTYVVWDPATNKCAIIDPGMINEEEELAMENFVSRNNLTVTHIINTHLHIDHAIGASFATKKFGAPIHAHPDDLPLGERIDEQARMFGVQGKVENVKIDRLLKDGDVIEIGEGQLEVIHVPGHSPGSIALYDKEDKFLISGDALFANSVGRADLPGGNMNQLITAIKSRLLTLPEETVVFPGHGPATTIGREKRSNPFLI